jgi:pilus assembly protein Flp/PilA
MQQLTLKFFRCDAGATAIEYAFIASFIALACIAALGAAGTSLNNKFSSISTALN